MTQCKFLDSSRYCFNILNYLEQRDERRNFLVPVNYKRLGLTNYRAIIKVPMDLSTCKKNLLKKKYISYEKFIEDLSLI